MTSAQVIDGKVSDECLDLGSSQSLTSEDKSTLANSSIENSPLLDTEKLLRYSARSRDEFWDALSSNYDYLMDDGLIATCREASSDLSLDDENEIPEAACWSVNQFIEQFKWLHDLLHNIQVSKESEKGGTSNSKIVEDQHKVAYLCKMFNDQAQRLSKRYPDMRDEVHRHLNRLNNKWKAVEQSINPNKVKSPSKDCVFNEIDNRMRNLRKWLRELENRLIPVNASDSWTWDSLEKRYKEQQEIQKEIEGKGKYISALLKLCEHLKENVQYGQNPLIVWDGERVKKVAYNLEHKWHTLWLKSLECHCVLENLMKSYATDFDLERSFTEEPLTKYPRLSDNCEELMRIENELIKNKLSYQMENIFNESRSCDKMQQVDVSCGSDGIQLKNDKGIMVGDTGIAELKAECQRGNGKFEIIQDVGYSSETSAHLSNDEKLDSPEAHLVKNSEKNVFLSEATASSKCLANHIDSSDVTPNRLYLPPDKYPSVSLKTLHMLSEDKLNFSSKYGNCKTVPDSFYKVTSVDEEVLEDFTVVANKPADVPSKLTTESIDSKEITTKSKINEASNEICNQKDESNSNVLSVTQKIILSDKGSVLVDSYNSPHLLTKKNKKGSVKPAINLKGLQPNESWKKSARVQEWLNTCQSADDGTSDDNVESSVKSEKTDWTNRTTDSSCDASGEYTTTESDSEKSNASDVNNSATLSQSFTGSIETVIPALQEESGVVQSDRAGSTEPSLCVRMRKKKRSTRERPWSVTDVHQSFNSSTFPHSTSESALDLLYSVQDTKKSKKVNPDSKRRSLTDISTLSFPSIKSLKVIPKFVSSKLNTSTEKPTSRRKKGAISDKGSEKYDSACSTLQIENFSNEPTGLLKPASNTAENKSTKTLALESSTSAVSENEKGELAVNEDPGSISDQAWDAYQDPPYLSEPYSEQTADEDEVKKLINFGDDYRTMLSSYSDTSSVSLKAPLPKNYKNRSKLLWRKGSSQESRDSVMSDSNSDSEDLHHILKLSYRAFQSVANALKENIQSMNIYSLEFANLVATCRENLIDLCKIHSGLSSRRESLSKEDIFQLQDLIKEWEVLQAKLLALSPSDNEKTPKSAELETAKIEVHCKLATLKEILRAITVSISGAADAGGSATSLSQLRQSIHSLQTDLSSLQETKESVLSLSARVRRLFSEGGGESVTPLKENASKLYQQWEDIYEMNCSQLTKLQALESRWHESTQSEMNGSSETTVQWQPVQVGDSLPTPQVSTEEFFQKTAAEIQVADRHDVLFEMETASERAAVECVVEKEDFVDCVRLVTPPALDSKEFELEMLSEESRDENPTSVSKKASCFWRALRAAIPIQFGLVILYCMLSLMEPQCCDNMNNYDFSMFPHLRYLRGPPPV